MKILHIHIENIASIEQADIDFEHGALAREPLFLICGETGAGKSTILDAICLALYNNVPRLQNNTRGENFSDATSDKINIYDVRNLLRRGTGAGASRVMFETEPKRKFQAEWNVRRAHNKANGKLQDVEWTLTDITRNETIASKKVECAKLIEELIGLNFEQFTRTVLLAQNQFAHFLQSEEKEKSAILEMLTGTELYSKISEQIHICQRETELSNKQLHNDLGNIKLLSDEEISQRQSQITQIQEKLHTLNKQTEQLNFNIQWIQEHEKQMAELAIATQKYNQTAANLQSETIRQKKQLLEQYNQTEPLRTLFSKIAEDNKYIISTNSLITNQKQLFQTELGNLLSLEKNIEQEKQKLQAITLYINKEENRRNIYEHIETVLDELTHAEQAQTALNLASEKTASTEKALVQEQTQITEIEQTQTRIQSQIEQTNDSIRNIAEQQKKADAKRLRAQKETLQEQKYLYENALKTWNNVQSLQLEKKRQIQQEKQLDSDIDALQKASAELQKAEKDTQAAYQYEQHKHEMQQLTVEEATKRLRAKLIDGQPCPVCGSPHHSLQADDILQEMVEQSQRAVQNAFSTWNSAQKALQKNEAEIAAKNALLKQYQVSLQLTAEKAEAAENELKNYPFTPYDIPDTHAFLSKKIEEHTDELRKITQQITDTETLDTKYKQEIQRKEQLEKQLKQYSDLHKSHNERITQTKEALTAYRKDAEWNKSNFQKNIETLNGYIKSDKWQGAWQNDSAAFRKLLTSSQQKWKSTMEQQTSINEYINKQTDILQYCLKEKEKITSACPEWHNLPISEGNNIENIFDRLSIIYNNITNYRHTCSEHQKAVDKNQKQLQEQIDDYNQKYALPINMGKIGEMAALQSSYIQSIREEMDELQQNLTSSKATQETLRKNVEQHQLNANKPTDNEDVKSLTLQKEKITEESTAINNQLIDYQKDITINVDNLQKINLLSGKIKISDNELSQWTTLDKLFGSADGKAFRNIAQSYTLRFLLHKANIQLQKFNPRYTLECEIGSLALLIRDKYMDNACRPVSTLSGGESFLVSLALALGLSSLTDERLKVETLFIDEGFGTLSANCLDTVMNVLEQLHNQGCKVGVISHIDLLKERIRTQIRVSRRNQSKSIVEISND